MDAIDVDLVDSGSPASPFCANLRTAVRLLDENCRLKDLIQQQDRRHEEYRSLQDLIVRANSGVGLSDILDRVYESFRPLIPFDRIRLALLEHDGELLRCRWGRSESPHIRLKPGFVRALEGTSLPRIIETGVPRILDDLEDYLRTHPDSESIALMVEEGMRSSLTCPLICMGEPIGFLFFLSMRSGTYQDVHVERFEQIASQISIIVEKGRLHDDLRATNLRRRAEIVEHKMRADNLQQAWSELELANRELGRLASRDGLTSIANRRTFDETLVKEWHRCARSGGSISLIMIDIDEFKSYNDSHGHVAGDECLRRIAQSLQGSVRRPGDLVSRYGGEEFAVLLPQTPPGPAYELAESMRKAVEEMRLPHGRSSRSGFVTISLGVSTMRPRKDIDPSILVATADLALYEGKTSGRNRVVVSPASAA